MAPNDSKLSKVKEPMRFKSRRNLATFKNFQISSSNITKSYRQHRYDYKLSQDYSMLLKECQYTNPMNPEVTRKWKLPILTKVFWSSIAKQRVGPVSSPTTQTIENCLMNKLGSQGLKEQARKVFNRNRWANLEKTGGDILSGTT
eukprot:sb/3473931/